MTKYLPIFSHDRQITCFAKAFVGRGRFFATLQCSHYSLGIALTKPFAHIHTINTQAQQVITVHVFVSMYDVCANVRDCLQ